MTNGASAEGARGGVFTVPGFRIVTGTHPSESLLPRHTHDDPTVCCIQRGRFVEYYRGKAVDCDRTMVKVTPAWEPHWNRFEAATTGTRINVDRSRFEHMSAIHAMLGERLFVRNIAVDGLARRLAAEMAVADDAARLTVEGLLLELLGRLARLREPQSTRSARWLLRANELIYDRYRSSLSLGDIAAAVGVDSTTLARAYRRAFGCTVGERIRSLRVEHAARELVSTTKPLSRIAMEAGFYDQSHFTNVFRRRLALTPREYRQRYDVGASRPVHQAHPPAERRDAAARSAERFPVPAAHARGV
jgi:AraC family transcriptional regulator